jgi:hypothetical protein
MARLLTGYLELRPTGGRLLRIGDDASDFGEPVLARLLRGEQPKLKPIGHSIELGTESRVIISTESLNPPHPHTVLLGSTHTNKRKRSDQPSLRLGAVADRDV